MKLITKFILIYLTVTVIVLGISGFISYFIIKGEVDNELKWEFMERIDRVTYLLEKGRSFESRSHIDGDRNLTVRKLDGVIEPRVEVSDTLIWHDRLEQNEHNVKVSAWRMINGTPWYISTYGAMIESDDITEAVLKTLIWILALQVVGAIGVGFFVSSRLFNPFRQTLNRIRSFKLQEKRPVPARETGVAEFNDLNRFVEEMTKKAVIDYQNLKEFTENASHELQTPLAIAKGKLELLTETDLTEEQYRHVEALEKSIRKLSRLSKSLALLTKIENHEFGNDQTVNLSRLVKEGIESFRELMEMRNLTIETNILQNVSLSIHPVLADILWSNLLQNAIKHNIPNGTISVHLTKNELEIVNTGPEINGPTDDLFKRFRKADPNSDSIGLGLSIIDRIVHENGLSISYTSTKEEHRIRIGLNNVKED